MKSLAVVLILTAILITVSADVQTESSVGGQSHNATGDLQTQKPLLLKSIDNKKEFPKETQMAQCTVQSADGLKVQAQATFSKKLDGICSTDDMKALKESLIAMESRLYRDIYDLRLLIQKLLPQSQNSYDNNYYRYDGYYQQPNYYDYSRYPQQDVYYKPTAASPHQGTTYQGYQGKNQQQNSERQRDTQQNRNHQFESTTASFITTTLPQTTPAITTTTNLRRVPEVINANKLKSLDTSRNRPNKVLTTTAPPKTTTFTTESTKIIPVNEYAYYWKLDNFPRGFQNAKRNEIFSHIFNVKGLYIRMRAELNLREDELLLLDIEHLAENTENDLEVEMSDGLIFKEIAEEKLFQYSFVIMDQNNSNNELVSPTYWNDDSDNYYKIPNSVHMLKSFLKDNSLLVKLIITF